MKLHAERAHDSAAPLKFVAEFVRIRSGTWPQKQNSHEFYYRGQGRGPARKCRDLDLGIAGKIEAFRGPLWFSDVCLQ